MKKNIGMTLLAVWLVLYGLTQLVEFSFNGLSTIMGLLAIAAGVLILMGR